MKDIRFNFLPHGRGYTIKQHWLYCAVLGVLSFVIILSVVCLHQHYKSESICSTPKCEEAARNILQKLDPTVDPCDDFYMFACRNFTNHTVVDEDALLESTFTKMSQKINSQLKTVLEKPITEKDRKYKILAKSFYQACMDTASIEKESFQFMTKTFKELGGWPVVEGTNWNETNFDWFNITYKFKKIGLSVTRFINFGLTVNSRLSKQKSLSLSQPALSVLHQKFLGGFSDPTIKSYYDVLVKIAVIFGADESRARKEMQEVIEFDIALTQIRLGFKEMQNLTSYNSMTIRSLINTYPFIPWLDYFNVMIEPNGKLNLNTVIGVQTPKYYERLDALLRNTTKRTLVNYLFKSSVLLVISNLNEEFEKLGADFDKIALGRTKRLPRWLKCVSAAKKLNIATGAMYIDNFFDKTSKAIVSEMVQRIRSELLVTIDNLKWMDSNTKRHALVKAMVMIDHVGYPDELLDEDKLDKYYMNLTIEPTKYLESYLNISNFLTRELFLPLMTPAKVTDWIRNAKTLVADAYYQRHTNSIDLPAGVLQSPLFDKDRPQYMNYGAIGFIIGHEITHAFDSLGSQVNQFGGLQNWWQPQTKKLFNLKAKDFIAQYGSLFVPEVNMHVNGLLTQGENIADNGGVKHAYLAYKARIVEDGAEQTLPGLPYGPKQLFWISAAQTWCRVQRLEYTKLMMESNKHAPSNFRVNIPLKNSEYFAKDFNCPLGSNMNPSYKVSIW